MARRLRHLILAALFVSLGVGAAYLILRGHLLSHPELLLEEAARRVDVSLSDIDYTQLTDGRKEWTLTASTVAYVGADDLFSLQEVNLVIYHPSGRRIWVSGREGAYCRKEGWISIKGQARIKTDGGYSLQAEAFTYRSETQELSSTDEIFFTGPGLEITGRGLKFDLAAWKAVVLEEVTTVLSAGGAGV